MGPLVPLVIMLCLVLNKVSCVPLSNSTGSTVNNMITLLKQNSKK